MANLLGDLWVPNEPNWPAALALPDVKLHLYGKLEPRPGPQDGTSDGFENDGGRGVRVSREGAAVALGDVTARGVRSLPVTALAVTARKTISRSSRCCLRF